MTRRKRDFAVIDCESDPFYHGRVPKPFIWGFYDGNNYEEFTETEDLIEFLFDKEIIVYAHNGGKFDFHYITEYFNQFDPVTIISGRLAKVKIGDCEIRDSFCILPVPLAAYAKDEVDYAIFEEDERDKPHNRKIIRDYLYKDCLYLYQLIEAFIFRHGLCLTQAGASFKAWKKQTDLDTDNTGADFYEDFQAYYYGGRVETFRKGIITEPFQVVDINSAYPFAMLHKHPYGTCYEVYDRWPEPDEFVSLERCMFHIRAISRGALPYRDTDGSLFFPNDETERDYHVTGWEVLAGLDTGTLDVTQVIEIIEFDEHVEFSDYINPLYEERKKAKAIGDTATDILAKLGMNSLYGKFASNPRAYKEFMLVDTKSIALLDMLDEPVTEKNLKRGKKLQTKDSDEFQGWYFGGMLGPHCLAVRDLNEDRMRFYNVVVAASITGFVRAYLWRAICKTENPLYCDTDSIAAADTSGVELGKELGQWDKEGDFTEAYIAGKKMYAFRYVKPFHKNGKKITFKIASKGVKLTGPEIRAMCRGETVTYKPMVPTYSIHSPPRFVNRDVRMNAKTAEDLKGKV